MATIGSDHVTLLDLVKQREPNGAVAQVVESLMQKAPLLEDISFQEGNLATGHVFSHRTGLPSVHWRQFNKGVPRSKSRSDQITETCGMLEGQSRVDVKLAELSGNAPGFRANEDKAFVQSMRHKVEEALFYSSTKTTPDQIMGLSPRFDATADNPAASQILKMDAAAAGSDQSSVWFVAWSPETVFGIVPKGSTGGLKPHDMGIQMVEDEDGNRFRAFETVWNWDLGLCVKDYRYIVRLCNIDTGNLAETGNDLIRAMVRAYHQLEDTSTGRLAVYCNRKIATYLHLQALDSTKNSTLTIENIAGKPVTHFLGAPIRKSDALLNTEAPVV